MQEWVGKSPGEIPDDVLHQLIAAEQAGQLYPGELDIEVQARREKALDSPAYLATEILDHWYREHFEALHYRMLDEVLAPYLIGETVRIEGQNYDPRQYTGLGVLATRGSLKSTLLRIMCQWIALYRKLRMGEDARIMHVHQVLEKSIEHSEAVRAAAKFNAEWRKHFPEFAPPVNKEWDTKAKWRWPCFGTYQATEWSWTSYGETSSKIGGHYTDRMVDDWVTDESVGTDTQIELSDARFKAMDNLRDRMRDYNPWLFMGTHYHYQDAYRRAENRGGWLIWKLPAHTGSPKRIFDLFPIYSDRSEKGQRKFRLAVKKLTADPPGVLNFPKLMGVEECVRSAMEQGPHGYNCQCLLNPMPEGEQRFDAQALDECWVSEIPPSEEMWVYVRVDPAISEKKQNDETAIVVGGVKWDAKRYQVDGWVGREKRPTEIVRKMFTFARKWQALGYRVQNIGVESVAYQEALAQIARDGVPEREAAYHGESVPMLKSPCAVRSIKRSAELRKTERILEMDGPVSRREVMFWERCPIARRTIDQYKGFPFDRFDILDAMHDLWVGTSTPGRPLTTGPKMDKDLAAILRGGLVAKRPKLVGTNNTVALAAWR